MKNYQWVKEEMEEKTTHSQGHLQQQVELVSTYNSSPKKRWRKVLSHQQWSIKQNYSKVYLANAKSRRHLLQTKWRKVFLNPRFESGLSLYSFGQVFNTKTAFNSPFRKCVYVKVPFGLAQTPAYFKELTTRILKNFDFVIAYYDNIIIFSRTAEEHPSHIKKVFEKLWSAKLSMKLSKCHFFSKKIQYLRHILSTKGIHPLPLKTQVIQEMHPPITPKQVWAFLVLVGYYRKFIKNFTKIAKPLTLLTWQQVNFEWTPEHQESFMKLKDSIIQAPILC